TPGGAARAIHQSRIAMTLSGRRVCPDLRCLRCRERVEENLSHRVHSSDRTRGRCGTCDKTLTLERFDDLRRAGDHVYRHIPRGALAADIGGRLVIANEDEHEILILACCKIAGEHLERIA